MKNKQTFKNSVERNKASSLLCKKLFPSWNKPPVQGELQRIIVKGWEEGADNDSLKKAGEWWLWFRNIIIENTFTKGSRELSMDFAIRASMGTHPIELITTRSPELLHAQVEGQGDKSLPRSKKALTKLRDLVAESSRHLSTRGIVVLADLAVDNFEAIKQKCDPEKIIQENLHRLLEISEEIGLINSKILRMSELKNRRGPLGSLVSMSGNLNVEIQLTNHANQLIDIAARESSESQLRMFGWGPEESRRHNLNLGITMGLVGESLKEQFTNPLLIHNEAFIARGQLNNLFLQERDPLPVICLSDLLERKVAKD